eukprot:gene7816-5624_t
MSDLYDILIRDFILAPKMAEELMAPGHQSRINGIVKFIEKSGGKIPDREALMLSVIRYPDIPPRIQVHNGNHRLVALARFKPDAKFADVAHLVGSLHDGWLETNIAYHYHVYTNFSPRCRLAVEECPSADGPVKRIFTKVPISFTDPEVFQHVEVWDGRVHTSFGLPISTVVTAMESAAKISYEGIGLTCGAGDQYGVLVEIDVGYGNAVFTAVDGEANATQLKNVAYNKWWLNAPRGITRLFYRGQYTESPTQPVGNLQPLSEKIPLFPFSLFARTVKVIVA